MSGTTLNIHERIGATVEPKQTRQGLAVRRAEVTDVPRLAELYGEVVRGLGPGLYTPEQVEAWAAYAEDVNAFTAFVLGSTTWIAEDGTGPVGFVGLADEGMVTSLYVKLSHIRQGIGSDLLALAIRQAQMRSMRQLSATASLFSLPVFERAGFRIAQVERSEHRGVTFIRYRMAMELCPTDQASDAKAGPS